MKVLQLYMKGILKNYTYIVLCEKSYEAVIIDPSCLSLNLTAKLEKICKFLLNNKITLKFISNTHGHLDHTREMIL